MRKFILPALVGPFLAFSLLNAYNVPAINTELQTILGSGYDSLRRECIGERVEGKVVYNGAAQGEWKMNSNMSSAEKSILVSGSAEVSVNYGIFSASGGLDINYVNKKTSHSISETFVYDVVGKNVELERCRIIDEYRHHMGKGNAREIFGDSFIRSLVIGGRLVLDITIEFSSAVDSLNAKGQVTLDVMKLIKGSANVDIKVEDIAKNSTVTIRAKQIGGNPSKLPNMIGDGEALMICRENYQACTDFIKQIFSYGVDFGEQLKDLRYDPISAGGVAVLGFVAAKYSREGLEVFPSGNPVINSEIWRKQGLLTKEYLSLIEDIKYIDEKLIPAGIVDQGPMMRDAIESNIDALVEAIQISHEYPDQTREQYTQYFENRIAYEDPVDIVIPKYTDQEIDDMILEAKRGDGYTHSDQEMDEMINNALND